MARKDKSTTEKRKTGSSGMGGSILLVVIFLWLGGLTFLWWTTAQKSGGNDLEQRVARLEAKSARVVKKINPPGSSASPQLESRIKELENKLSALSTGTSAADAASPADDDNVTAAAAVSSVNAACNCDGLIERMNRLEKLVLAKSEDMKEDSQPIARTAAPVESDPTEEAAVTPAVKPKKAPRAAAPVNRKKKRKTAVAKRQTPQKRAVKTVRPKYYTRGDGNFIDDKNRIYGAGGQSIYEMTRKFGPMVGDSAEREKNIQSLAPGAGVYPYSSSTYQ